MEPFKTFEELLAYIKTEPRDADGDIAVDVALLMELPCDQHKLLWNWSETDEYISFAVSGCAIMTLEFHLKMHDCRKNWVAEDANSSKKLAAITEGVDTVDDEEYRC